MKVLLLVLMILMNDPLREVEDLKLLIPTEQYEIFRDYSNDNFSQKLAFHNKSVFAEIKSSNFFKLNLNFRVVPDKKYLSTLSNDTREIVTDLFGDYSLKAFLINVSLYLEGNIRYTTARIPQDALSVIINKQANCIGFSNTVKLFLDSAGIKNQLVSGFYLKREKGNTLLPIPHRWVEIQLPDGAKFFYDPQYQKFSANYITTKRDVNFKRVRKFKVNLIKQSKRLAN